MCGWGQPPLICGRDSLMAARGRGQWTPQWTPMSARKQQGGSCCRASHAQPNIHPRHRRCSFVDPTLVCNILAPAALAAHRLDRCALQITTNSLPLISSPGMDHL